MATILRGCARSVTFRPGEYLLLEGDAADVFYLVRRGQVTLETRAPGRPPLVIETLRPRDRDRVVLAVPALSLAVRRSFDRTR